jgi:hypothetical protein
MLQFVIAWRMAPQAGACGVSREPFTLMRLCVLRAGFLEPKAAP